MIVLTKLEQNYIDARCKHSVTAQRCWKLRAALDREGFTWTREQELNGEFARQMAVYESPTRR